jgi:hypothetical protein
MAKQREREILKRRRSINGGHPLKGTCQEEILLHQRNKFFCKVPFGMIYSGVYPFLISLMLLQLETKLLFSKAFWSPLKLANKRTLIA